MAPTGRCGSVSARMRPSRWVGVSGIKYSLPLTCHVYQTLNRAWPAVHLSNPCQVCAPIDVNDVLGKYLLRDMNDFPRSPAGKPGAVPPPAPPPPALSAHSHLPVKPATLAPPGMSMHAYQTSASRLGQMCVLNTNRIRRTLTAATTTTPGVKR